MEPGQCFSEEKLACLSEVGRKEACLAAVYAFDQRQHGDCNLAALYTETPAWADRLDLELAMAEALGLERVQLFDLRRMPLVSRFGVVNEGEPLFVGQPEALAVFIEETLVRYSAFYPLLEALYWRVETRPLAEDMLDA
jgi:hypothetical protein